MISYISMNTTIATKSRAGALRTRQIPKALSQAAGLLRGKLTKTPIQYQKALRKEW